MQFEQSSENFVGSDMADIAEELASIAIRELSEEEIAQVFGGFERVGG